MQMKVTASPTVAFFDSGGTVIKVEPSKPLFGYSEIETNVLTYCNNLPAQYRLTTNKICWYEQKQKHLFFSVHREIITCIKQIQYKIN